MPYVLPFILAMATTMAGLPLMVRLARHWHIVDQPGGRKVHTTPIPRVGGLAMACGVAVAALTALDLRAQDAWLLVAGLVLVVFGALDDRFDLDYRIKFAGQLIAVGIAVFPGQVVIRTLTIVDAVPLPDWISLPLTFLFLVGVTNAINLADGLDGLAGGTTFLCLCAVALLAAGSDGGRPTAMALTFAGAVLGFLRFNTYPASVFMGDAGSQLLGFFIGALSISASQSAATQVSASMPLLLLALPIVDTLSVMVQRVSEGRSPFSADRNHIHHKLLALGLHHHEAVMVIYVIQAMLLVAVYFLRFESDILIVTIVTAFFALSIVLFQFAARRAWRVRSAEAASVPGPASSLAALPGLRRALPRLSGAVLAVSLALYACAVLAQADRPTADIRWPVAALLAAAACLAALRRRQSLLAVEKALIYSAVTLLVYLDAFVLHERSTMTLLSWVAVASAALATAVQLRLANDRRFRVTPLDLLVVFIALIVPSIPGVIHLPNGVAAGIAKLVILLYATEVLVTRTGERALWLRAGALAVLAAMLLRVA